MRIRLRWMIFAPFIETLLNTGFNLSMRPSNTNTVVRFYLGHTCHFFENMFMKLFQSHTLILAEHLIRYFTFCNQLFKSRNFQNLESNSIEVAQRYRFQVDPEKFWAQKHFESENILSPKTFWPKNILNSTKFWAQKHFELKNILSLKTFCATSLLL